ncbi:uncharacterized protein DC041_0000325 [Schistosoma bovis]|uniref:Uncharacterized protein n=1 Tax=Schistosoma bovis TaxID=6184 RepID=A0A430Q9X3_SCHBO|nr:uncharacterized protein DC041_0000325 [Schistosoma bovis]
MAFVLAIVEVFIIPFCVCFEKAKTACEFIDRIYKVCDTDYFFTLRFIRFHSNVFAFDPIDNARYMRPLLYNPGIPVPSSDPDAPQFV